MGLLLDLQEFKCRINEQIGQDTRIVIKKSIQRVDPEWIITILRIMKLKRFPGGIKNPWNAFQSAFAEPPFEIYSMTRRQVAMLYRTTKDHLNRHVEALTAQPTNSLWDYVPEPRLHSAQPLINDARIRMRNPDFALEACFTCNVFGPCLCTQQTSSGDVNSSDEDCENVAGSYYYRAHPQPPEAQKNKEDAEDDELLERDADDARSQWVEQMTNLTKIAMPLGRKITSTIIALIAVAFAVEPCWSSASTDVPGSLLQ